MLGEQTAVRRGAWKLTLNGHTPEGTPPEGTPPEDAIFLADLATDAGEKRNLAAEQPAMTAELTNAARQWRAQMEAAASTTSPTR